MDIQLVAEHVKDGRDVTFLIEKINDLSDLGSVEEVDIVLISSTSFLN